MQNYVNAVTPQNLIFHLFLQSLINNKETKKRRSLVAPVFPPARRTNWEINLLPVLLESAILRSDVPNFKVHPVWCTLKGNKYKVSQNWSFSDTCRCEICLLATSSKYWKYLKYSFQQQKTYRIYDNMQERFSLIRIENNNIRQLIWSVRSIFKSAMF